MSFASLYTTWMIVLRVPAVIVALAVCSGLAALYVQLPDAVETSRGTAVPSTPAWPEPPPAATNLDWSVFKDPGGGETLGEPDFAKAFRFSGTFFLSEAPGAEVRKAVLSVHPYKRQEIASEGDTLGGVTVTRIFKDHVVLRQGAEVAELWLNFASPERAAENAAATETNAVVAAARFGKKVADDSWVLKRESLLDYWNKLLDEPERLLQVFDSLKPLYDPEGSIEGYQLGIEGERDFFKSVGFREGDVVRKVNSLPMTRRSRAEFFIKQVVESKLSAVVIDIERGGESRRMVYRIR